MKKFWTLLSMTLVALCVFATGTACGTAKTFKPFYDYLQSEGGSEKLENLNDPIIGTFNIEFSTDNGDIKAKITWANNISDTLTFTFHETDNQHVNIHYTIISFSPVMVIGLDASCTNLEDLSTLAIQSIYYTTGSGTTTLEETDASYTNMKKKADKYLPETVRWLSAMLQVLLDDESVSVQDLYNPS